MDEETKKAFCPGFIGFISGCQKVRYYLVRAKVYPLDRRLGSFWYDKCGCHVCLNYSEVDTFVSIVTKQTYKTDHKFNCRDKCLIHLLSCY